MKTQRSLIPDQQKWPLPGNRLKSTFSSFSSGGVPGMKFVSSVIGVSLATILSVPAMAGDTIDLSGPWNFKMDEADVGEDEGWYSHELPDQVHLPGTMRDSGLGPVVGPGTKWIGQLRGAYNESRYDPYRGEDNFKMPFWLQPERHYVGPAWYQRSITIPDDWRDQRVTLMLERPHWHVSVWIDDQKVGTQDSLSTAHHYDLTGYVTSGQEHRVTLRINNDLVIPVGQNAHSVSDNTQTAWHGVVGRIELQTTPAVWIANMQIFPDIESSTADVHFEIGNQTDRQQTGRLRVVLSDQEGGIVSRLATDVTLQAGTAKLTETVDLGEDVALWDEYNPHLYTLEATIELEERDIEHVHSERFGVRHIEAVGTQFMLNGNPIYLRGTLENAIFPLTGYPPTDVESWKRIIEVCKAYGLNHIRFHSWCPPRAAFQAADELGFYLQTEASHWANQGSSLHPGNSVVEWLYRESEAIIQAYGNHPSFILFASGNEPAGPDRGGKALAPWVEHFKERDSRRLVTSASGWPIIEESQFHVTARPRLHQWGEGLSSRLNSERPATDADFSGIINQFPNHPVISHEIGQWCAFPNFDEIEKYTGALKARNFEIFREFLEQANMIDQAEDFLMASGKLQVLAYKEEIEAALRTPGMGGFQLLDLQDFSGQGTALVGVVDAFWDPKPYVSAEEYARFAGPIVPLARMEKRSFTSGDTFKADIEVAQFGPEDLQDAVVHWKLIDEDRQVADEGAFDAQLLPKGKLVQDVGSIAVPMSGIPAPGKLTLEVSIPHAGVSNDWDIWVYPDAVDLEPRDDIHIANALDAAAIEALQSGGRVILMSDPHMVETDIALGFTPIFWNTAWTGYQPPHTLGILTDPAHPGLEAFPTEYHSNWQWADLVQNAAVMELDHFDPAIKPIVQVVPDWVDPKRLALVFEARVAGGALLVTSIDLRHDLSNRPEARQLLHSLLNYVASDGFTPEHELTVEAIQRLFQSPSVLSTLEATAKASSANVGTEPEHAIDQEASTIWHSQWQPTPDPMPHHLIIDMKKPQRLAGIEYTPRQDIVNGRIKDYAIFVSADGSTWGEPVAEGSWPDGTAIQTVRFDNPQEARYLKLEARSSIDDQPFAAVAGIDVILAPKP